MTTEAQDFESRGRLNPVGHLKRFSRFAAGAAGRLGGFLKAPATRKKSGPQPVASVSSGRLLTGQYEAEPEHGCDTSHAVDGVVWPVACGVVPNPTCQFRAAIESIHATAVADQPLNFMYRLDTSQWGLVRSRSVTRAAEAGTFPCQLCISTASSSKACQDLVTTGSRLFGLGGFGSALKVRIYDFAVYVHPEQVRKPSFQRNFLCNVTAQAIPERNLPCFESKHTEPCT